MTILLDASSANTLAANSVTVTTPGFATSGTDELLVSFFFGADNVAVSNFLAVTSPATGSGTQSAALLQPTTVWTEVAENTTTTGADTSNAHAHAIKTAAGDTGEFRATAAAASRHGLIVAAFKFVASSTPTLSGGTVFNILQTSAQPRVTLTF